jgi:crotonobetainyl-CoA:carnitine CoA-transferase CaiB-like acyl-CoA transferase
MIREPIDSSPAPLAGRRVIDLTHLWAGPLATRIIGELGAEVIKIEGPRRPDPLRLLGPGAGVPSFDALNSGKLFAAVDLGSERGRTVLARLVAAADGVVDNLSPRAWSNWGVEPADWARQLGVVWISMPAFARGGAFADRVARGSGLEGTSGYASACGRGGEPLLADPTTVDPVSGSHAAFMLLCALRRGQPIHVELSQNGLAHSIAGALDTDARRLTPPALTTSEGEIRPAARTGAHTVAILRAHGYTERQCDELLHQGTVFQACAA